MQWFPWQNHACIRCLRGGDDHGHSALIFSFVSCKKTFLQTDMVLWVCQWLHSVLIYILHSVPTLLGLGLDFCSSSAFSQVAQKCNMMRVSRPICYQFCVGDPCHRNTHSSPPYPTASSKWRPVLQPVPFQHQPTDEAVLSHVHCDWLWRFHKELSDKTWGARK